MSYVILTIQHDGTHQIRGTKGRMPMSYGAAHHEAERLEDTEAYETVEVHRIMSRVDDDG